MRILILLFLFVSAVGAQSVTWTQSNEFALPDGVKLYAGSRTTPALKAWYLDIDLSINTIALRPYLTSSPKGITSFVTAKGAYAGINGGFFGGNISYSAVVAAGEVKAQNIAAVSRSDGTYPITRSLFSMAYDRSMSVDWIWHFDATIDGMRWYDAPLNNAPGSPATPPQPGSGNPFDSLMVAIGGGPTLVKNGTVHITYDEEVFWDSGVGYDNRDPRTAVGYTTDGHAILLVADGRQSASQGFSLPELAQVMIDLGCIAAMNLDGGGSTQMAIGNSLVNLPEGDTYQRPLPSILAVVHNDSLGLPAVPQVEKIIDTGDAECSLVGPGWFATANTGYWGGTPSLLNSRGTGDRLAVFSPNLSTPAFYEVYGWWVAASNRCTDTPFVINHAGLTDTVRANQTQDHGQWSYLGSFWFDGDSSETVTISNAATQGTYIVADAVRLVSFDTTLTALPQVDANVQFLPGKFDLGNYPNPFNNRTLIRFNAIGNTAHKIRVFDTLGREIWQRRVLAQNGPVTIDFDAGELPSGTYLYQVSNNMHAETGKMLLLK